jgi:hypothetical protein
MPNAVKLREVMSRQKPSFLENQLLYYEGMVQDITGRKRAEEEDSRLVAD